jgi:sugar O-acyltransferase (sialic acid O-acetyltransferase NeuD family)
MPVKNLILIGGGGHCRSCIEVIESSNQYRILGIIDGALSIDSSIFGYPVLGGDERITEFVNPATEFLITVGQIESPAIRIKLAAKINMLGGRLATIVASTALVSKHAVISEGTIIMHQAFVNAGAKIGSNCIINSKALLEHDVTIENNCHISTGALVNGGVKINQGSFVGSGSVIVQMVELPENSFVKANSLQK